MADVEQRGFVDVLARARKHLTAAITRAAGEDTGKYDKTVL
ncbi:hypothetical protein AB0L53_16355 [Nonomuraea sp. NPDC052129]